LISIECNGGAADMTLSLSHLNGEEGIEEKLLRRKLMDKKLTDMRRKK